MVELKLSLPLLIAMVVASMNFHGSSSTEHVVGGSLGWTTPPDPNFYVRWSQSHTFIRGDVLVFNFTTGLHDVGEVTTVSYDRCDGHNPISLQTTSPARFTITRFKTFIISTHGQDCNQSQKIAIMATDHADNK